MTGTEIYKRTATYEREAHAIRLHVPQWKLLLAFDGQHSLAEVALSAEVSFTEAVPMTEEFLGHGWIEEQPITLDQYLKRTGTPNVSAIGTAARPDVILHKPHAESIASPSLPSPAVAEKSVEPSSVPVTAPTAPPAHGPMRLSAVVDYVTSLAENVSLGQLMTYRVFLRVPPELLQAEGIVSVHLIGDTSLIQGQALQKAIARAVDEVTKRQLSDSVFAPA